MCEGCNGNCGCSCNEACAEGICLPAGAHSIVGSMIPEMELEAYHKDDIKKIKLSDYKGKWLILFFYPGDFTFVCPTELEEMAHVYPEFQKMNTEVLSVSTDGIYVHKAWHDASEAIKKVTFPMVSDQTGRLACSLGVHLHEEGISLRGTFLVNPEGKIVSVEINDNSIGRSAQELIRKVQAAQFVAKHKGKVCPASWKPGDEPLEPGLDLVGKI